MAKILTRLAHFLEAEGITQKQAARDMGVSPQYINALYKGRNELGKENAAKFQQLYGVSSGWLLTGEGPMYTAARLTEKQTTSMRVAEDEATYAPVSSPVHLQDSPHPIPTLSTGSAALSLNDSSAVPQILSEQMRQSHIVEQPDLMNALLAAKDETIATLQQQLAERDDQIRFLRDLLLGLHPATIPSTTPPQSPPSSSPITHSL